MILKLFGFFFLGFFFPVYFIHLFYSLDYRVTMGTHDAFSLNRFTHFVSISLSKSDEMLKPVMDEGPIYISEHWKDPISVWLHLISSGVESSL